MKFKNLPPDLNKKRGLRILWRLLHVPYSGGAFLLIGLALFGPYPIAYTYVPPLPNHKTEEKRTDQESVNLGLELKSVLGSISKATGLPESQVKTFVLMEGGSDKYKGEGVTDLGRLMNKAWKLIKEINLKKSPRESSATRRTRALYRLSEAIIRKREMEVLAEANKSGMSYQDYAARYAPEVTRIVDEERTHSNKILYRIVSIPISIVFGFILILLSPCYTTILIHKVLSSLGKLFR